VKPTLTAAERSKVRRLIAPLADPTDALADELDPRRNVRIRLSGSERAIVVGHLDVILSHVSQLRSFLQVMSKT
jgi:hypothetical protein